MNIKQYGTMLATGALLALSANPVYATVCDQPSPLQELLGEQYWDVELAIEKANEPRLAPMTRAQTAEVLAIFELLGRNRYKKAEGIRHVCKGAPDQRRTVEYDSTLRRTNTREPTLRHVEDIDRSDLRHVEPIDPSELRHVDGVIPPPRSKHSRWVEAAALILESFEHGEFLREYDDQGQRDRKIRDGDFDQTLRIALPDVSKWLINSDNTFQTTQLNRRRNVLGYSNIQQIDTEIAKTSDGIRLSQTLYINGNRETWASWTLVK